VVNPLKFTNFNLSQAGLQEYILFAIAVAGKPAVRTAKLLDQFLGNTSLPFELIKSYKTEEKLREKIKSMGFGCHTLKAKGFWWIANSGLDLKTCSVGELEKCPGIGMKSSRFFAMHTRKEECGVACLDTHILHYLRDQGFPDVPKSTPTKKAYLRIERFYLDLCRALNKHPVHFDLEIWNKYSGYQAKQT